MPIATLRECTRSLAQPRAIPRAIRASCPGLATTTITTSILGYSRYSRSRRARSYRDPSKCATSETLTGRCRARALPGNAASAAGRDPPARRQACLHDGRRLVLSLPFAPSLPLRCSKERDARQLVAFRHTHCDSRVNSGDGRTDFGVGDSSDFSISRLVARE